ncbi:MAG: HIT family protein [Acidimicrobiales bacterium]
MSDGLGRLWAGWRTAYVTKAVEGTGGGDCVLCAALEADAHVLWRGRSCAALLNAYPYTSGHLMVLPLRHAAELEDLGDVEAVELWSAVRDAVVAIKSAYRPGGVNVGMNLGRSAGAGLPGHLHVHVLPRWDGDTNFMTTVAGVRVLPETLDDTFARLVAAWPSSRTAG